MKTFKRLSVGGGFLLALLLGAGTANYSVAGKCIICRGGSNEECYRVKRSNGEVHIYHGVKEDCSTPSLPDQ